jgi:hypothetical protein
VILKKSASFFSVPGVALLVIVVFHPTANLSSTNGVSRFILDWILLAWMAGVQSFLVKAVIHASKA